MAFPVKLALSTCWLSQRHVNGEEMLREVADLGFEYAELSHGIPVSLVPGILDAVEKGVIKISSTHNFCPLPPGVTQPSPNYYEPSAGLKSGRAQWVRHTKNSIAFAQRVGADRMVVHSGSIRFFLGDPTTDFRKAYADKTEEALAADADYLKKRDRLLSKLKRSSLRHYRRVHDALSAVAEAATAAGVKLGLENRDNADEIPLDAESADYFKLMADLPFVGSWHDTGHARIKERMGLIKAADLMDATAPNRLGFHLHNVTPTGRDHQSLPSEGTVDFSLVKKHLQPGQAVVLEFSSKLKPADIVASREYAEKLIREAFPETTEI